jgi:SOS-response transcriptional repressor LexA
MSALAYTFGHAGRRKRQVLAYIEKVINRDGIAPSYGMIERDLGMTNRGTVYQVVKSLERDGCIRRVGNGRVRRIRLADAK